MTNTTIPTSLDALAVGRTSSNPFVDVFAARDPTVNDVAYPVQKKWLNTAGQIYWVLEGFVSSNGLITANWQKVGTGVAMETVTGNTGQVVPPFGNNVNIVGDGVYISTNGVAATSTLTISPTGALTKLYTAQSGTATPMGGNLNVFGSGLITTTASGNTITINASGSTPWQLINSSISLVTNNSYLCVGGGALSLALPTTSVLGDIIQIALNGSSSFTITQQVAQQIRVSGKQTTIGTPGTVATTGTGDTINLVCQTANTVWVATSFNGNLTVT